MFSPQYSQDKMKRFLLLFSRIPLWSGLTFLWRKRALLITFSLSLILFGMTAFSGTVAQDNSGSAPEPTAPQNALSAAACPNVNYRTIAEPRTTEGDDEILFTTSPNADGATLVDVGLYVVSVTNIDELENSFQVEAFSDMVWCDPRLAFPPSETGTPEKFFLEEDAETFLEGVWWPDVTFVNEAAPVEVENQILRIFPGGSVKYERVLGLTLEGKFNLRKFPFDSQTLPIEQESFAWDKAILEFHEQDDRIGFSDEFELPEWRIKSVDTTVQDRKEVRDRAPFSEFIVDINVTRLRGYYLYKILFPLLLLIIASWSVFWMSRDALADRLGVSLTGTLSVVAYQFLISESLPRISIITFMDSLILVSFTFMILTVFENVAVSAIIAQDEHRAEQIDLACRWIFPVSYCLCLALASLLYLVIL